MSAITKRVALVHSLIMVTISGTLLSLSRGGEEEITSGGRQSVHILLMIIRTPTSSITGLPRDRGNEDL